MITTSRNDLNEEINNINKLLLKNNFKEINKRIEKYSHLFGHNQEYKKIIKKVEIIRSYLDENFEEKPLESNYKNISTKELEKIKSFLELDYLKNKEEIIKIDAEILINQYNENKRK